MVLYEMQSGRWKKYSETRFLRIWRYPLIFFIHLLFFLLGTETRNGIYYDVERENNFLSFCPSITF